MKQRQNYGFLNRKYALLDFCGCFCEKYIHGCLFTENLHQMKLNSDERESKGRSQKGSFSVKM